MMLEEEFFMGQWHPLISLWTKRNILINNKTRGITATWHLNINSMHVKYFHITILNTLNKCQGLKNYHFGSLLASKFYCVAIKAVIKKKILCPGIFFPRNTVSFWTIKRAIWGLKHYYCLWSLVIMTTNNFYSCPTNLKLIISHHPG